MNLINISRLKGISKILYEINYLNKTLKKYRKVLKNGKYYMFPSMRAMVVNKSDSYNEASKYFSKNIPNSKKTRLINLLNKGVFSNNFSQSEQLYEAFYVANNYDKVREVKLFSFERKKILTVCACHEDFDNQTALYNNMHQRYNMPLITRNDTFKDSYEISMVGLKPRLDEVYALQNILYSVMNDDNKNFTKALVSDLVSCEYDNDEMNQILSDIRGKISCDLLNSYLPICEQHGDLSRDNLIYGEADGKLGFWWIDWEHISSRMFLYDYFFYILNTALYYKDTSAYEIYINGNQNEDLEKYFTFFEVDFHPDKTKDYFLVFLIVFLKERVCNLENLSALKMYYEYVKELNLL